MKNVIIFLAGAAIGGAAVWFYQEHRYNSIIDDEINSVKEMYAKKEKEETDISKALKEIAAENVNKPIDLINPNPLSSHEKTLEEVERILVNYQTKSKSEEPKQIDKKEIKKVDKPYIIDQSEFREFSDYGHVTLDYYIDGVLADADHPDDPIEDPNEVVGDCLKNLTKDNFEDWVYIRSDAKKLDYEVYINPIEFSERED